MTIHRTAAPIPIRATRFRTWAGLIAELALGDDELASRCVISDLALGAWRGHWVARELYAQLGLAFPTDQQPRIQMQETRESGGGYFGELTDNEARGDFTVLFAYRAATEILAEMRRTARRWIAILAPLAATWGADNIALLRFLARGCTDAGCELVLVYTVPGPSPSAELELHWLGGDADGGPPADREELAVIPGVLPAVLAGDPAPASDHVTLADGSVALSPRSRGERPVRAALAHLPIERLPPSYEWLNGYALATDPREPNDPDASVLLSGAIDRLCEGGNELALRLLAHARSAARSVRMRAATEMLTQHVLLRLRAFEEASRGPVPADDLPPPLRLGLLQSKGWGLTMVGKAAEAEPLLEQARALARPESRAYLYLLNISALNQLRLGRHDSALALEKTIEQALAATSPTDWHATYINSINQARLYKKSGELAVAEAYYDKAFAIVDGLRSTSDLVYRNLCFAQLEMKKGNRALAVRGWLRAALHWLASEVPEALAPRVVEAITLGRGIADGEDLVERVSDALRAQLVGAASIEEEARALDPPVFAPASAGVAIERAVGNHGWGLFIAAAPQRPRFAGPAYRQLAREVWRCVRSDADVPEHCSVLVDDQLGREIPQSRDELVSACVRHGVTHLTFAGQRLEVGVPPLRAEIGPGVARCVLEGDAPMVVYKRYRKPLALAPRQVSLLQQITSSPAITSIEALTELRALEKERVLWIAPQ